MEVIMGELKKGDIVEIIGKYTTYTLIAKSGCRCIVSENVNDKIVKVDCTLHLEKKDIKKVGEFKMDYETSNRKKLKDAVIKTGFNSKDLSIAMGFNDNYLSGYISKSRMSERGDISEDQLNSLKVSILFAERTLNGTGAETVDELKFGDAKFECSSNITKADKKEINVKTEIDSELQFIGGGYDPVLDMPESKNTTSETHYLATNNHASKYSNFIKLQKLSFVICFIMAVLLISILYFVVSK